MSNSNFLDVSWKRQSAANSSQKAIAIVQKAIEEDVKQNYAVRRNTGSWLTARKPTSSIKMHLTTSCW